MLSSSMRCMQVGKDHVLQDEDIVQLVSLGWESSPEGEVLPSQCQPACPLATTAAHRQG